MRRFTSVLTVLGVNLWWAIGAVSWVPAAPAPPTPYVFVPFAGRSLRMCFGGVMHIGVIDARGKYEVRVKKACPDGKNQLDGSDVGFIIYVDKPVRTYEFRSDRLILGTMMPDGEFIPEAGSKVVKFSEYDPSSGPEIWNLPGYFLRKEVFEAIKKDLAGPAGKDPYRAAEKARMNAAIEWKK